MKEKKKDQFLGHKFVWNGDVKQCKRCGKYLGLWDWESPCAPKQK